MQFPVALTIDQTSLCPLPPQPKPQIRVLKAGETVCQSVFLCQEQGFTRFEGHSDSFGHGLGVKAVVDAV